VVKKIRGKKTGNRRIIMVTFSRSREEAGNVRSFGVFVIAILLAAVVCFNSTLAADEITYEEAERRLKAIGEEQLLLFFEPGDIFVTSSARRAQPIARATSAMYVISAEDIRQAGVTKLAELMRLVPGMDVHQETGYTYGVSARGLAKAQSQRLQILLDGMPVFNPYRSGQLSLQFFPLFLDNIERIEVIRGSGGVIWGSNAMNGVINIITKKAADTQGTTIYTGVGNRAYHEGFVRLSGSDERLDWRGTTGLHSDRGLGTNHGKDHRTVIINDSFRAFQASGRGDLRLDEDTTVSFMGGHKHSSYQYGLWERTHESIQYMNILWGKQLDEDSSLQIRGSLAHFRRIHWDRFVRARENMIEFQHNFVEDIHSIVWGIDYTQDVYLASRRVGDYANPDGTHDDRVSGFIEDEIALADDLWLTIGTRQHYNQLTHYDWAGRVALVWEVEPKHFLRAGVSRSFRKPSFEEEYRHGGGNNISKLGNDSLRNEKLLAYELGYRGMVRDNLELNVEGFINKHEDLIAEKSIGGGLSQFVNAHNVTTYGIETAIDWKPYDWWLVRAFHAYEHQTENSEVNVSTRKGALSVFLPPKHKAGLTNRLYLDETTTLNTQVFWYANHINPYWQRREIAEFFRFDVRLGKKLWNDSAEIAFGVTNLQEQAHYEGNYWEVEVPRIFYVQFYYTF